MTGRVRPAIEDDVPLPRKGLSVYPFALLAVGQSFLVAGEAWDRTDAERTRNRILARMSERRRDGALAGRLFTTRIVEEGGRLGVRCWRIE